jgi:hypothetical protein
MSKRRNPFRGLRCVHCGELVKQDSGRFSQPLDDRGRLLEPWAEHWECWEAKKA